MSLAPFQITVDYIDSLDRYQEAEVLLKSAWTLRREQLSEKHLDNVIIYQCPSLALFMNTLIDEMKQ